MHVIVIGAGATGLATAYLLARNGAEVTLLEASKEPGGLLSTFDVGNGSRLEYFYHHFFTHDAEIRWLLQELGLHERVLFRPTTMGIYRGGRVYDFNGPLDVLGLSAIDFKDRLRFGATAALLTYLPGFAKAEETAALAWFERWAGQAATEAIWRPMLDIKFGEAASSIPLAWMAGRLRQRARSREGMTEKLGYLEGSLQVLVDALVAAIERLGARIQLATPVEELHMEAEQITGVQTADGPVVADAVVSTIPTPILAKLVRDRNPAYATQLETIKYMGATCTVLAYDRSISPVYWLNVADGGYDFGGVIEQTRLVDPEDYGGRHILYLSRYLSPNDPLWSMDRETLVARHRQQLERLFPDVADASLLDYWVFKGRFAAPITDLGFHRRIPSFAAPVAGLYTAAMPHVYPDERSTNNSIRVAANVVKEMGFDTSYVPKGASLAGSYGLRDSRKE